MTKGSKAWVEFFENHIDSLIVDDNRELYFSKELVKELEKCGEIFPYNGYYPKNFNRDWNNSILKPTGGGFSPSRINVVIGIVSFLLFSIVEYLMFVFVLTNTCRPFIPIIAVVILLIYMGGNWKIYRSVKSGFLNYARSFMER